MYTASGTFMTLGLRALGIGYNCGCSSILIGLIHLYSGRTVQSLGHLEAHTKATANVRERLVEEGHNQDHVSWRKWFFSLGQ